jgi:hypothetical protein
MSVGEARGTGTARRAARPLSLISCCILYSRGSSVLTIIGKTDNGERYCLSIFSLVLTRGRTAVSSKGEFTNDQALATACLGHATQRARSRSKCESPVVPGPVGHGCACAFSCEVREARRRVHARAQPRQRAQLLPQQGRMSPSRPSPPAPLGWPRRPVEAGSSRLRRC